MAILTFHMAEVCILPNRFNPGTEILSLYIILPSFIQIGQELFEIIDQHTQTDTQTDRHTDTHTRR